MYQVTITDRESGQRFDKYLYRILPQAGSGFLYKMLRKKNITLNDRKAEGSEKLVPGDQVKIYFAGETLARFMGQSGGQGTEDGIFANRKTESGSKRTSGAADEYLAAYHSITGIEILYENRDILMVDKPAGILSQKGEKADRSLNEWLIGYLLENRGLSGAELSFYKPSVCNRLDRNTSGIVLCAKSLKGAQLLAGLLKDRTLHKYYQLYVKGILQEEQVIEGYLRKDGKHNKVYISPKEKQGAFIRTRYRPLRVEKDKTLLEVELITGKPHQIRAHLAGIGHPLLGDYKYGDRAWNDSYRKTCQVKGQLLHAYKVVFPQLAPPFEDISGQAFYAKLPEIFEKVSDICKEEERG